MFDKSGKIELPGIDALLIDWDDYFGDLAGIEGSEQAIIAKYCHKPETVHEFFFLTEIYYYLIRNSFVPVPKRGASEAQFRSSEQAQFDLYRAWAVCLADEALKGQKNHQPGWVKLLVKEVGENCRSEEIKKALSTTTVTVTHDNSQTVVAKGGRLPSVTVSSIVKPLLLNYNLFILSIMRSPESFPKSPDELGKVVFQFFFPYFLHGSHSIKPTRLPRTRALDKERFIAAKQLAHYQSIFLFLHELAHVSLGHLFSSERVASRAQDKLGIEIEADVVAAGALFGWPREHIQGIYLALEILFHFHAAMRNTANRVLPLVRPTYIERPNVFKDRYSAIRQIKGPVPPEDCIRNQVQLVRVLLDLYEKQLRAADSDYLRSVISRYTSPDGQDHFLDFLSERPSTQ